ncbi:MAG: hypothetical protein ACHP8A_13020 [Terriglobales bacterium]
MFETIKTIREAFEVPSWAFILMSAFMGFLLFAFGAWIVDRVYQKNMRPPSAPLARAVSPPPLPQKVVRTTSPITPKRNIGRIPDEKHPGGIKQTSNSPYSPNIVTGDDARITINNPAPNPYGSVATWDYNGAKRTQGTGFAGVVVGDEVGKFQRLIQLEAQSDWQSLLDASNEQIKSSPTWPTPYLFAAEANVHLNNSALAKQQLEAVERTVFDSPDYASQIAKVRALLRGSINPN